MFFFSEASEPAYIENASTVFYITDETGNQIAVVPLDKEVDQSKVYVNPRNEEGDDNDNDDNDGEHEEGEDDEHEMDTVEGGYVEMEDEDIGNNDDNDDDDDDDDDYDDDDDDNDDDDDDDGDDDDMHDSDDDFIPNSQVKSTTHTVMGRRNTRSNAAGGDDSSEVNDNLVGESGHGRKQKNRRKKKPNIKEINSIDVDTGAGKSLICPPSTTLYRGCSYKYIT